MVQGVFRQQDREREGERERDMEGGEREGRQRGRERFYLPVAVGLDFSSAEWCLRLPVFPGDLATVLAGR